MNIKRAKEEIKNTIEAYLLKDAYGAYEIPAVQQRPVFLMGPPGVGKTQIMGQVARECGIGLVAYTITHHTRQSAVGLPFINEKEFGGNVCRVTEYTMSEIVASIYNKIEDTGLKEGILFIDEINCVSETLAPTMLQFLQYKTFGNHRIPDGWVLVTAGNPPEYNKSVRDFDVVTLDRLKLIHVEPDFEVWKAYAYEQSIHPAVISYLNARTEYFCRIETTVDGKFFATPRGWEDLSKFIEIYERLGKKADRDVVGEYIQFPVIAKDFANYLEIYYKYRDDYQIDEILTGIIRESLCNRLKRAPFDEKLNVMGLLLSRLGQSFRSVSHQGDKTELLLEELKKLSPKAGSSQDASMADRLEALRVQWNGEWERKRSAGLLNRREDYLRRDVEALLLQYEEVLRRDENQENETAWNRIREMFEEEKARYDSLSEEAGNALEHAFDFMEAAFGDGQEMVVFLTELNTGFYSVKFLKEYDCERYYQYNERLLFKDRENEIKARIDGLGK
ncbi:ATP-binding protein [Lacrimispora saccharolytica]|uniref:ATPase associated with various cellular activities AAA_5 n=1 Tax=Lacrimispora saccharolytica (strain ATCC 35040 / DSM 2544 / NRCC 2533 / WM1) TaxID=610130 RepID=D9R2M7_LACSW|nr:AAA family ATPase [Lacrimispora saccharolytica]ADL06651.1 ATPase associated with various cellular activities AAA_5 [[Clostridium] saccharolyticum WM1]QRV19279.1 AAA family ATPase [Lacrimispora saccharolytica]